MAGGGFSVDNAPKGKVYPGELTKNVKITCIVAAMGGLIFGYDIGISGGVTSMAPFLEQFFPDVYRKEALNIGSTNQYCKFNSQKLTMFTSSLYFAALLSSLVASTVTKAMGRKLSMILGGLLFLCGAILNGVAQHVWMLILGRVLLGFGIGFANQSVPVYLSEMAPQKYRGALNMMFQMSITIGILAANVLNYFTAKFKGSLGWRVSLGCAGVPAIIFLVGSSCLPDTPNSLIHRGRNKEARRRLQKIRGVNDVDDEFNDMVLASEEAKKVDGQSQWKNLRRRKYRPQLTFAILIPFFQQLTGMNVIMFYAPVLFKTLGFGGATSLLSAVITGVVNSLATLVAIKYVDHVGRRILFLEGGIQMLLSQIATTVAIALKFGTDGNPGELPKWYASVVVVFICIYVAAFAWSWGPLGWLVPSEIFPLEVRSAGQSINVMVNMIFTFFIAEVFLDMMCAFKFGLFIFFACFVLAMTIFIYVYFPETKGVPIEEMMGIWSKHPHWKKYVSEDDALPRVVMNQPIKDDNHDDCKKDSQS